MELLAHQEARTELGHLVEGYAAALLRRRGLWVRMAPCRLRSEEEDPGLFRNEVDIEVGLSPDGPWRPVEVKSKDVAFSEVPERWPFADVTLFRTGKGVRPIAVLLVSSRTGAALGVLSNGTAYVSSIHDQRRGYTYPVWAVAKHELMRLDDFAEKLKERL